MRCLAPSVPLVLTSLAVVLTSAEVSAQSSTGIAGVVKDASGAVLPGVNNVMNRSTVLAQVNQYGFSWRTPTSVLDARIFKVGLQMNF